MTQLELELEDKNKYKTILRYSQYRKVVLVFFAIQSLNTIFIVSVGMSIFNGMYEGKEYQNLNDQQFFDLSAMCVTVSVSLLVNIVFCIQVARNGFLLKDTFNEWSILDQLYIMDYKQF